MSRGGRTKLVPWEHAGWSGHVDPALAVSVGAIVRATKAPAGRQSRHATTSLVEIAGLVLWVKVFDAPGAHFARRAPAVHAALAAAGLGVPRIVAVGWRGRAGLLVTEDVGGSALVVAVAEAAQARRRALMDMVGRAAARLHAAGFVAGDLVPSNVVVRGDEIVLLDHDRTRRSRVLVWWNGRRNLVQLGRFVMPGVRLTDRARVLRAYARGRHWGRGRRHRLARWVVAKIRERRARFDGIPKEVARTVGFGELMQSGGPWDYQRGAQ